MIILVDFQKRELVTFLGFQTIHDVFRNRITSMMAVTFFYLNQGTVPSISFMEPDSSKWWTNRYVNYEYAVDNFTDVTERVLDQMLERGWITKDELYDLTLAIPKREPEKLDMILREMQDRERKRS